MHSVTGYKMTHKIAIITTREFHYNYGDDYDVVINSITDWAEVSVEDFKLLYSAQADLGYTILEQPVDTPKFVAKTVADYMALAKAEELRIAKIHEARAAVLLEKKFKKELKAKESKRKLLEQLQKEAAAGRI